MVDDQTAGVDPDDSDESNDGSSPKTGLASYLLGRSNRGSTADDVTDALREAILDGVLPASSWLREVDLAQLLNVSRTPIREAIRRLVAEDLVVRVPNHGAQVTPMRLEDILAVYTVRENLEGLAARLAAQRADPEEIRLHLSDAQTELHTAAARGDSAAVATHNLEFHRGIRELAGNAYLDRFLTLVEHSVRRFGRTTFEIPGRMDETVAEHEAIIAAIQAGDGEAAEQAARSHMRAAREARLNYFLLRNG
jgi:DNA-binding GntR family transcriptional regulator